ncbi:MAG: class I SAM-dependent methyltransferase [Syntrophomonadaceae bacterium]|jgi:cyclopropane-fatty-acyl-phospholipid synthase
MEALDIQKGLYRTLLKKMKGCTFAVTFWDGETDIYNDVNGSEPIFHLTFKEKIPASTLMSDAQLKLGEAYMQGKLVMDGDLKEILQLAAENANLFDQEDSSGILQQFLKRQKHVSSEKQADGVKYHYNLGNDFFKLWLDPTMSYSCAYFRTYDDPLEKAQMQKIDHTLRKLNLKPGETLLDIGSGWGWLIINAAKKYGVKSLGITLSEEQYHETTQRIEEEGLKEMVQVRLIDYRSLASEKPLFDKIVSIGMFEHVGKDYFSEYFEAVNRMLKPGGLSLLHTITRPKEGPTNPWLQKYIFPWGYIPSFREVIWELPEYGFHLLDAESLRMHYSITTDHWAKNFEQVAEQVQEQYGEEFVRMWRLYLNGCSVTFACTGLDIHQILFSKGLNNNHPLTREHIYLNTGG